MTLETNSSLLFHLEHNVDSSAVSPIPTPRVEAECLEFGSKAGRVNKKSNHINLDRSLLKIVPSPILYGDSNFGKDRGIMEVLRTEQYQQPVRGTWEAKTLL